VSTLVLSSSPLTWQIRVIQSQSKPMQLLNTKLFNRLSQFPTRLLLFHLQESSRLNKLHLGLWFMTTTWDVSKTFHLLFPLMDGKWISKLIWMVSSSLKPTCRTSFGLVITWMFWFQLMDSNNRTWQCLSQRIQSGRKSSSRNEWTWTFRFRIILYKVFEILTNYILKGETISIK
jgi:hypothetical protein